MSSYASATPNNAESEVLEEDDFLDLVDQNDLLNDLLYGLYRILSGDLSVLGPNLVSEESATASNADEFENAVYALDEAVALSADSETTTNVIRYDVSVGGTNYVLYLSPDYVDQIYIDSSNRLWNVGTNQITGRLFTGQFNALETTGRILYLGPCLGNNFSNNRNYGSPNYVRQYYWSGNSLTYNTTYVTVTVLDSSYPFRVSDTLRYVIIFLLGGVLICLWKRSSR